MPFFAGTPATLRHTSEALTMIPVFAQHFCHGMPFGSFHAAASFAYHSAMAMDMPPTITSSLLVADKVMILLMLQEVHVWANYTDAIAYERFVVWACGMVGAFTFWFPVVVDIIVATYVAIVIRHMHTISQSPKLHLTVAIVGAASYVLGITGVMHACMVWAVGNYHAWIDFGNRVLLPKKIK